ncbi:MAG: rRNA (cytidine-2'-O-)-methyltransferase, partial [Roseovarius sp.]
AAVCRELTKKFEEVRRGTLEELAQIWADAPPKGEIVVIIDRGSLAKIKEVDLDRMVLEALTGHSMRDAADLVAANTGLPRREIYQRALFLAKGGQTEVE